MATKKPSPAQLAARKRFGAAAKAGTLQKGVRLKNPGAKAAPVAKVRVSNPRKTVKSEIASRKKQIRSVDPKAECVYIVETASNNKHWKHFRVTLGAGTARILAENLAEDYPRLYVRVRKEKIED